MAKNDTRSPKESSMVTDALWDCPLTDTVEALQDEGYHVYIWGWTADGGYALVRYNDDYYVASRYATNRSIGRWECPAHAFSELLHKRFPLR